MLGEIREQGSPRVEDRLTPSINDEWLTSHENHSTRTRATCLEETRPRLFRPTRYISVAPLSCPRFCEFSSQPASPFWDQMAREIVAKIPVPINYTGRCIFLSIFTSFFLSLSLSLLRLNTGLASSFEIVR